MDKLEKIISVIGWIIVTIGFLMIIGFTAMIIMLARYDDCRENGFQYSYCEKYKDFQEVIMEEKELKEIIEKNISIVNHYGVKKQMPIWIEELSELTKVICKWLRKYDQLEGDISE